MNQSAIRFFFVLCLAASASAFFFLAGCDGILDDSTGGGSSRSGGNNSISTDTEVCGDPKPILGWPMSGYFLEFNASHEIFHVWVASDAGTAWIEQWLADPAPETLGIPGGPIERDDTYNDGYSYRLIPTQAAFAADWDAACDAAPCYVEDALFKWITSPNTWCPLAAKVVKVWNCGAGSGSSCGQIYPPQE